MLLIKLGDLFESDCQAIVNTVNCVGVAGAGVALGFKKRYPEWFREYQERCKMGFVKPGSVFPWSIPGQENRIILSVATKNHWKHPSQYQWIWEGVGNLHFGYISARNVKSIAMPFLGCGNGGLDKGLVLRIIQLFHDVFWTNMMVTVYEHK